MDSAIQVRNAVTGEIFDLAIGVHVVNTRGWGIPDVMDAEWGGGGEAFVLTFYCQRSWQRQISSEDVYRYFCP